MLGDGTEQALRSTRFCAVWRYKPLRDPAKCEGDKTFRLHSIGYQMAGGWKFHGKKRPALVETGTVIAGSPGQHYGCKHAALECESVCAISLLPGALDEFDQAVFDKQLFTGMQLPRLERWLTIEDDDQLESLVFEVFDCVSRASLGDGATHRPAFRVQRMKRFIERHAFENIALADIARCLDLSPFTCIRQFKSSTGITPIRYLRRLRFERAQTLLRNRHLSIGDVARSVGIEDRFYFTRWFSKEAGVPPQTFRQIANR